MQTQTQTKDLQVREGRIELQAQHLDSEKTFIYPPVRGTYNECVDQLKEQGLYQPTFSEVVSLTHSVWQNPEEKYSKEIIKLMKYYWLRGFTGILYMQNEGAYIQDHPEIKNGRIFMDRKDLIAKLESKDPSVRFVPFGYKLEDQTASQLAKNPFVIGLTGSEEQAEKVGEIADKYRDKPHLWRFNSISEPITRASPLYSDCSGYWLFVNGYDLDDNRYCYAFGVSAPKVLQ